MIRRALSALAVLVLLAGCGGAAGEEQGTATLWVTRDRGAQLLVDAEVNAGQTLMRALAAEARIETGYGGRFLRSVNGLEGSLQQQQDWFWFVNGYEGDRSAAEYRLRDGDVAWWDYRAWRAEGEARIVVGAFPEPFLHGYAGRRRPAAVRYGPGLEERARELADAIDADSVEPIGVPVAVDANHLEVRGGAPQLRSELLGESAGAPVRFVIAGEPDYERKYEAP